MKGIRRTIITSCLIAASIVALLCALAVLAVLNGVIILNARAAEEYPVKGVDVSAYQGEIDWEKLTSQNILFAFIKATEGSSFCDKNFAYNYAEAQKNGVAVGAYHFFSYDSDGKTQAENFISTVEPCEGMLPPVIDLEFYEEYVKNPPPKSRVDEQLQIMLNALEAYYGLKPIIYATEKSYRLYLSGGYEEYDVWIRNVVSSPRLPDGREWTFWQYTNRGKLEGYEGTERFIDINVFFGSAEEFEEYLKNNTYKQK